MGTVSTELDLEWESSKRRPPSAYANGLHVDAAKSAHPIFGNGGDKMRVGFSVVLRDHFGIGVLSGH